MRFQLIRLHDEMRSSRWMLYPEVIRRAAAVAYAAHMRVRLEFFHDGRRDADLSRVGYPTPNDLKASTVSSALGGVAWTDQQLNRLCDADKLLGHLSQNRPARTSDWGRAEDWELLRAHVDRLLSAVPAGLTEARTARGSLP